MELTFEQKMKSASLFGEINSLAYMINAFTKYGVFINYYGHVKSLEIRITSSKENYNDVVVNGEVSINPDSYYLNWERGCPEKMFLALTQLKYQLRKILRENKIDYSKLAYEVEEVKHYKLV